MRSLSDGVNPGSIPASDSSMATFVRFPLCPSAKPASPCDR